MALLRSSKLTRPLTTKTNSLMTIHQGLAGIGNHPLKIDCLMVHQLVPFEQKDAQLLTLLNMGKKKGRFDPPSFLQL